MTVALSIRTTAARTVFAGLSLALGVLLILNSDGSKAHAAVGDAGFLGAAESYAVLAHTTATNDGALTLVEGDLGVSPGTAATGFGAGQVTGSTDIGPTSDAAPAKDAASAAYVTTAGSTPTGTYPSGEIGGSSPVPGVYSNAMQLTGTITLNGDSDDVWVFQSGSTLTTAAGSSVVLLGNANPCNVYWQVGSSATLGTGTSFAGTVLAQASISLNAGASVAGRLLAQTGAVTLLDNHVFLPSCTAPDDDEVTPPTDEDDGAPPTDEDGDTPPAEDGGTTPPTDDDGAAPTDGGAPTPGGDTDGDETADESDTAGGGITGGGTPTGATLPDTGSDSGMFLIAGVLLTALGTALLLSTRRRAATGA